MIVACGDRFEYSLMQSQPGFSAEVLESHRYDGFGSRRLPLLVRPGVGEHEPLGFHHLAQDSLLPMIAALRIAHVVSIRVAGLAGALQDFACETSRAQPLELALGLRPRFEDEAAWRIEDPRDNEHAVGGFSRNRDTTACSHIPTPRWQVRL